MTSVFFFLVPMLAILVVGARAEVDVDSIIKDITVHDRK